MMMAAARLSAARKRSAPVVVQAAMLVLGLSVSASAAAPTLTHVVPPGGQRGTTVTVTCKGKFDWPASVATGGVKVTPKEEAGKLDIEIPADLAADRVWIRLYNAEGASAAVPFLVGCLKELNEEEPNNAPSKPQKVSESAVTINGLLTKGDVDGFEVTLQAGQTLVASLDANTKLGSPLDSILQIATGKGFVLAENHDEVGLDPRLVFQPKESGAYIVRAFAFPATPNSTIAYSGDDSSQYRLTLTTGPSIAFTSPLSAPLSDPATVGVLGWNLPSEMKLAVIPFGPATQVGGAEPQGLIELEPQADDRIPPEARIGLVYAPEAGSARARLVPFPVISSIDAAGDQPVALPVPGVVMGRLREPAETDRYRLSLTKGQPLLVIAEGRSDFPIDPVLHLADPKGKIVATLNDPSPKKSQVLSYSPAADGDYELRIRDRFRRGSEWSYYQLTARLDLPDFELTTSTDAVVAAPDKPAELTINVQRRGSNVGPITIEALDLPEGVTAAPVISEPKGDTSKKVTLKIAADGKAFSGPIRIQGTAKEPSEIVRTARTPVQLGACFDKVWLTATAKP